MTETMILLVLIVLAILLLLLSGQAARHRGVSVMRPIRQPLRDALARVRDPPCKIVVPKRVGDRGHPACLSLSLPTCSWLDKKDRLWSCLSDAHGPEGAARVMPKSLVLPATPGQLKAFHASTPGPYFVKANVESGKSIRIARDAREVDEILRTSTYKPVVIQKSIEPMRIGGYAFKLRLFVIHAAGRWYVHHTGFVYTGRKPCTDESSIDCMMANAVQLARGTSAIRKHYQGIPVTARAFFQGREHLMHRAHAALGRCVQAASVKMRIPPGERYGWVLGTDVVFDTRGEAWVIEMNVLPGSSGAISRAFPPLKDQRIQVELDMIRLALGTEAEAVRKRVTRIG
jgi:hypothetical protein